MTDQTSGAPIKSLQAAIDAHPWIWPVAAVGFAIWLAALVAIVRSPKFLRKILWVLLTFISFSYQWRTGDVQLGVGIPIGALYVLWFWRFGPSPTPERIADAAARAQAPPASSTRVVSVRAAYVAALVATALIGWAMLSGGVAALFAQFAPLSLEMVSAMTSAATMPIVLLVATLVFLIVRPYWWGKILAFWTGLSWSGFSAVMTAFNGWNNTLAMTLAAGVIMLMVGIAHQLLDPRWSGTYLRAS